MLRLRLLRRHFWLLRRVSVLAFLLSSVFAFAKEPEDTARSILKAGAACSLLSSDPAAPHSLAASFSVHLSGARRVDGKYVLSVTPRGDWAKQLFFADYSDLQVARGATVWIQRSVPFQPLQAAIVQNAFNSPLHIDEPGDVVDRYFKISDHHIIELRCVDLLRGRSRRTFCVDPDQNLTTITLHSTRITYQYSDFRPVGKRFVPYRITGTHWGKAVLDIKLDKVALDSETVSQLPTPAEGSLKRAGCLSPTLPTLKHSEFPGFPMSGPQVNSLRRVMLYALIGSDGSVKNATVTQTGGQAFDSSALEAVRRWQYEPAKCGDTPVEFETELSLNFSMEIQEELFGWPR